MSLSSMTGFARGQGQGYGLTWTWEIKSVNGRNLDSRSRLPSGMDSLEPEIRRILSDNLKRGHVNVLLQVTRSGEGVKVRINQPVLDQIMAIADGLSGQAGIAPPRLDGLLRLSGVLETTEEAETEEARAGREQAMLADFESAVGALVEARVTEGARLHDIIAEHISALEELTNAARACSALTPANLLKAYRDRVRDFIDGTAGLSEERIAQEVAILAAKADVREEVDRLDAHIEAAKELIGKGGAVGRRLDFLAQELMREANTLCAKAADMELTRIGLELKAVIDQTREQIQNLE